jgi:redox-sensing transcriptional repressor
MGIVGIGNLGSALLLNQNFSNRGFHFVAAFDSDPEKIGDVSSSGLVIRDTKELKESIKDMDIDIGVISTRSSSAQEVVDSFIEAGVNAILNFSPVQLNVPDHCVVEQIDFTIKLDILTYKLKHEIGSNYIM